MSECQNEEVHMDINRTANKPTVEERYTNQPYILAITLIIEENKTYM